MDPETLRLLVREIAVTEEALVLLEDMREDAGDSAFHDYAMQAVQELTTHVAVLRWTLAQVTADAH